METLWIVIRYQMMWYASESLEMFHMYYMHSDIYSLTTHVANG